MAGQLLNRVLFKRIIALTIVKQRILLDETECDDQPNHSFLNSPPCSTKSAIGLSHLDCQFNRSSLIDLESLEFILNGVTVSLTRTILPHLAQKQIRQTTSFNREIRFKPFTLDDSKVSDLIPCHQVRFTIRPN